MFEKSARAAATAAALGLACAFAPVMGAGQAHAQAQNSGTTNVTFCNNTGAKIFIALVYYEARTSRWMLSAWKTRNPGQCASSGSYRSGIIYYFAEKEGGREYWPAKARVEKTFCVPRQAVERVQLGGNCAAGERLLGFRGFNATTANFKFNFD
jgi:hypothetical protein